MAPKTLLLCHGLANHLALTVPEAAASLELKHGQFRALMKPGTPQADQRLRLLESVYSGRMLARLADDGSVRLTVPAEGSE